MSFEDRFQLKVPLGESSHGAVWSGHDRRFQRPVAVYLLDEDAAPAIRERFLKLIDDGVGSLRIMTIARVVDAGVNADGLPYIATELLADAPSLEEKLAQGPAVKVDVATRFVLDLLTALTKLGEAGLAHGDIEPGNVRVLARSARISPRLIGLGLNRAAIREGLMPLESDPHLSSLCYMAPEQAGPGMSGASADAFSAVALLFSWITGRLPFRGADAEALRESASHLHVPRIGDVREDLRGTHLAAVIDKALSRNPADRYEDTATLTAKLRAALLQTRVARELDVMVGDRTTQPDPSDVELSAERASGPTPMPDASKAKRKIGSSPPRKLPDRAPAGELNPDDVDFEKVSGLLMLPDDGAPQRIKKLDLPPPALRDGPPATKKASASIPPPVPPSASAKPPVKPLGKASASIPPPVPPSASVKPPVKPLGKPAASVPPPVPGSVSARPAKSVPPPVPGTAVASRPPSVPPPASLPPASLPPASLPPASLPPADNLPPPPRLPSIDTRGAPLASSAVDATQDDEFTAPPELAASDDNEPIVFPGVSGGPPWPLIGAGVAALGVVLFITVGWLVFGGDDEPNDEAQLPTDSLAVNEPEADGTDLTGEDVVGDDVSLEDVIEDDPVHDLPVGADLPDEVEPRFVSLTGLPEGAELFVDGESLDGRQVQLEDASIEIEVRAEGYETWQATLEPDAAPELAVALVEVAVEVPEPEPPPAARPPPARSAAARRAATRRRAASRRAAARRATRRPPARRTPARRTTRRTQASNSRAAPNPF